MVLDKHNYWGENVPGLKFPFNTKPLWNSSDLFPKLCVAVRSRKCQEANFVHINIPGMYFWSHKIIETMKEQTEVEKVTGNCTVFTIQDLRKYIPEQTFLEPAFHNSLVYLIFIHFCLNIFSCYIFTVTTNFSSFNTLFCMYYLTIVNALIFSCLFLILIYLSCKCV